MPRLSIPTRRESLRTPYVHSKSQNHIKALLQNTFQIAWGAALWSVGGFLIWRRGRIAFGWKRRLAVDGFRIGRRKAEQGQLLRHRFRAAQADAADVHHQTQRYVFVPGPRVDGQLYQGELNPHPFIRHHQFHHE